MAFSQENSFVGKWVNEDTTQVIEIYKKNDHYFGKLIEINNAKKIIYDSENKDENLKNRKLIGIDVLLNFEFADNKLKNGEIYNINNGNTYNGKLQLKEDELILTGYFGVLFFLGKTQKWYKFND